MDFLECNLINQYFVLPMDGVESMSCPREEIVDPVLLRYIIDHIDESISWDIYTYDGIPMFRTWIPFSRTWKSRKGTIRSSGVYFLTEKPSMFISLASIIRHRHTNVSNWLEKYWNTLFLVTCPVFTFTKNNEITAYPYAISTQYPLLVAPFPSANTVDTLEHLLQMRSYTIANGMTLVLGMNRIGYLDGEDVSNAIDDVMEENMELYQQVPDTWNGLYYGHATCHIADHPWLYTIMGRKEASKLVRDCLRPVEDEPIPITNTANGIMPSIHVYTSAFTVMLPYLKMNLLKEYVGEEWPYPPFPMDEDDSVAPDLHGFVMGITRSKVVWDKWWMTKKEGIFDRMEQMIGSRKKTMKIWLSVCFRLYARAKSHYPRLCYSRIRQLWMQIVEHYDAAYLILRKMLQGWALKCTVMQYLDMPIMDGPVPFAFLKDMVEKAGHRLKLYAVARHRIYSEQFMERIRTLWPDGEVQEDGKTMFLHRSCMRSLSDAPIGSVARTFYEKYLVPRITNRLCIVQNGFGMRGKEDSPWYTVGQMMMYWYEDHKDELIRG